MRDNLDQLPDLVRWAARNQLSFVIVTHMLPYADETRSAAAFDTNTDRALELFREWRERAAADGVDLGRYFDVFMKFRTSPADARVIAYVREMIADATAQGVTLSVERLLGADELHRRVQDTFAEAAEIARAEGITLKLPSRGADAGAALRVRRGRRRVRLLGRRRPPLLLPVAPVRLPRRRHREARAAEVVRERRGAGLLALWSGAPSRAFREEVLRYEFPFCYDCNVALCDYSQPGEFVHDCHVGTVPCGACLWSTGVFQCLS